MQDWLFLEKQAQINEWIQRSFFREINDLWMFLRYFDVPLYYYLLCAFFTVFFSRNRAVSYLYLLVASSYFTNVLKSAFNLPRPSAFLPHLDLIALGQKQGMPSGAAMGAIVIGIILARHLPKVLGWVVGLAYVILVSMSRVYLGVHFVSDLIGGWLIGALLWVAYFWLIERRHFFVKAQIRFSASMLIIGALFLYAPVGRNPMLAYFASGIALGAVIPVKKSSRWLRFILAPLGIWVGLQMQYYFLMGFYLSFGVYFLSAIPWGKLLGKEEKLGGSGEDFSIPSNYGPQA